MDIKRIVKLIGVVKMLKELINDINKYGKVYVYFEKYDGNIKVDKKNYSIIGNVIKIKTNDGFIVIPENRIYYYEI
jgi:hypothetical protein